MKGKEYNSHAYLFVPLTLPSSMKERNELLINGNGHLKYILNNLQIHMESLFSCSNKADLNM